MFSLHKSLDVMPRTSKKPTQIYKNKEQTRITCKNIYNYDKVHIYIIEIIRAIFTTILNCQKLNLVDYLIFDYKSQAKIWVVHTCNSSAQEAKAGRSEVQAHPQIPSKFQDGLKYMTPC